MTRQHSIQIYSKLACLMSLLSVTILSYPLQAQAHLTETLANKTTPSSKISMSDQVPKDLGSPETGRRRGGTSR